MAKSPEENAPGSEILRYDLGWKAINDLLRSGRSLSGHERNCCFLNLGAVGAEKFADVSAATGGDLDDDGRVLALADWDYDGDPDMWLANRSGPQLRYLRNDLTEGRSFLAIRLEGTTCNRDAIGARVSVLDQDGKSQTQTVHAGQGYLAQSSRWLHFGLGENGKPGGISVRWPDGKVEQFTDFVTDGWLILRQASGKAQQWEPPVFPTLASSTVQSPDVNGSARVLLLEPLPLPELDDLTDDVEHARLISLWADWCSPCLTELKEWSQYSSKFSASRLEIVALNVSETENIKKWEALDVPFQYRFGDDNLVEEFDVLQRSLLARQRPLPLPSSFLIDSNGHLRAIYRGSVSADQLLADVSLLEKNRAATLSAAMPFPGKWRVPPGGSSPTGLAVQFIEGGYSQQAQSYLETLASQPEFQSASVFNLLGALYIDQKKFADAAKSFANALKLDPNNRQSHIELGGLLLSANRGAEAEKHFGTVLQITPNDPELIQKFAIAQLQQNKFTEARKALNQVISLSPNPVTYRYLLKVEQAAGNSEGLIATYEKASKDFPELIPQTATSELSSIAEAYASINRFSDAASILIKAVNRTPEVERRLKEYQIKAQ